MSTYKFKYLSTKRTQQIAAVDGPETQRAKKMSAIKVIIQGIPAFCDFTMISDITTNLYTFLPKGQEK